MHPNVSDAIADDLDLLRLFVGVAQRLPFDVFAQLRWMNPEGVLEEFADLLQLQLDLRTEATNLERFHANFRHDERVAFPRVRTVTVVVLHILDITPPIKYMQYRTTML
jgi:aarF domain-containing kinase